MSEQITGWVIDGPCDGRLVSHPCPVFTKAILPPHSANVFLDPGEIVKPLELEYVEYHREYFVLAGRPFSFWLLPDYDPRTTAWLASGLIVGCKSSQHLDAATDAVDRVLPGDFQQNRRRICRRLAIIGEWFRYNILQAAFPELREVLAIVACSTAPNAVF